MKGMMRFSKKGKLNLRYVSPYRILKRVGNVAYELKLPVELVAVHPVYHISLLKKCVGDPASIVLLESVAVRDNLTYEEVTLEILERKRHLGSSVDPRSHPRAVVMMNGRGWARRPEPADPQPKLRTTMAFTLRGPHTVCGMDTGWASQNQ
ncbi:hypothetical protein MTR67_026166 [Solanum verrucosum]|uniref:Tf2-1-like SH3-like domain-containing protein n=1 Tax=Solanum verrucosum TaxID=315347 RepID=A0AAF0TU75_SOLVR|nr:hypothetical protein MTR67_026166 [Solanum verrucosum]